ncbi:MAG: putative quinol monooxygenase [Paludibacter sp.]|jgi:quinol monooxygenase YgiN|nr:putative quinol monooxygenase [Paludibacter sp.]
MIRLNVFISVEDVNLSKVLDAAKELTASSVKEDGCIAYDVYESATRPNVLLICETWKDSEALSNHEKGASFIKNSAILKEFTNIKLEKFEF